MVTPGVPAGAPRFAPVDGLARTALCSVPALPKTRCGNPGAVDGAETTAAHAGPEGPPPGRRSFRRTLRSAAGVAKLADARDSKSRGASPREGSTPFSGTSKIPAVSELADTSMRRSPHGPTPQLSQPPDLARDCLWEGRRDHSRSELLKMMLQMAQVVSHPPFEWACLVIANEAWRLELCGRHALDDGNDVAVQCNPQLDQLGPCSFAVSLDRYPRFLVVPRQHQWARQLSPNETLVVVGRRVNQMAQDFLLDPLAWLPGPCQLRPRSTRAAALLPALLRPVVR